MKTNFHTHNYRCRHAVGNVEDYVKVAIREGYTELGISDHAPLPLYYSDRMGMEQLEGYLKEIEEAQKKYEGKIKIYKSLEIEYFPEFVGYYKELREKLDYMVLGLHGFKIMGEDRVYSSWKVKSEVHMEAYADYMVEALKSGYFDYVAHPDLYMAKYPEWTKASENAAHKICNAAEILDIPLEVNANGIRKFLSRYPERERYGYPYKEFWDIVSLYKIRSIIGSDAHDYNEMEDDAMNLARDFAKDRGLNIIDTIFEGKV